MIKEDYVSFETAKLLKEKGFEEHVTRYYFTQITYVGFKDYPIGVLYADSYPQNQNNYNNKVAAPTLQMTMKWLREIQALNIYVRGVWKDVEVQNGDWELAVVGYEWFVESLTDDTYSKMSVEQFLTYEEACEVAIKYCLENLI